MSRLIPWLTKFRRPQPKRPLSRLRFVELEDRCTPATFTINTTSDVTAADGNLTLREAITSLNLGNNSGLSAAEKALVVGTYGTADTIVFTGLTGTITIAGSNFPLITKNAVIAGPGASSLSISGGNAFRHFDFATAGTTFTISGLTLSNGTNNTSGGSISISSNVALTLADCILSNNTAAGDGGAIRANNASSNITIQRSTLSNNRAGTGGNGQGGAIWANGIVSITDSTFHSNSVVSTGGFKAGGAINFATSSVTIRNSTFNVNSTTGDGGAINFESGAGTAIITNSTIASNTASGALGGGGIARTGGGGAIALESTLVAVNVATATANEDFFTAGTVTALNCGITTTAGVTTFTPSGNTAGLVGQDFLILGLGNYGGTKNQVLALMNTSPAINKGSNPAGLTTDGRGIGFVRSSGTTDIGAYEVQGFNLTVNNTLDTDDGDIFNSDTSLREAFNFANANTGDDAIFFNSTIFNSAKTITLGSQFNQNFFGGSLTLNGPAQPLTISGNNAVRHFDFDGGTPTDKFILNDLTLTAGKVGGVQGGSIRMGDESLTLNNVTITNSSANGKGGAIGVNSGGSLTLNTVTLSGNSSGAAGGAVNTNGSLTIVSSSITNNTAVDGGGIYVNGGTTTITGSTFNDNFANGFAPSSLGNGGGLNFASSAVGTILNSTFSNNRANRQGGGIESSSNLTIRSSTLTDNTAVADGGAFGNGGGLSILAGAPLLHNTLIIGNFVGFGATPSDIQGGTVAGTSSNNLIGDSGSTGGITNGVNGNITGKALATVLATSLAANGGPTKTHLILAGGAAHNAGNAAELGGATTDQRGAGFARNISGAPDIGAVELPPDFVVRNTNDAGTGSLRQAVLDANAVAGTDTVTFDSTVFNSAKTITLTGGQLIFTESVNVTGPGAALLTISGNNANRIFAGDNFNLSGVTLTAGKATGAGGAVNGSTIALTDCVLSGNSATGLGGALYASAATITRCVFSGNTAGEGGAASLYGVSTVTDSLFTGNVATANGGAMEIDSSTTTTIRNSTFTGNSATTGAGAISAGAASFTFNGTLNIQNCTITGNTAPAGAAVQLISGTGTIDVDSTIISGNSVSVGDIGSSKTVNVDFSAIGSNAGFTLTGGNNRPFFENLKLRTLANNGGPTQTVAFEFDSPLRNAGSNVVALTNDARGLPRNDGAGFDIGAFELNTLVTNTNNSGVGSLRDAVAEANRVVGAETITFDSSFATAKTVTLTSGELSLTGPTTITGKGASLTTISGNNASRIFSSNLAAAGAVINYQGLTLTGGKASSAEGGAIEFGDEIITVSDSVLTGNSASEGGAIDSVNAGGNLTILRSTISNNTSSADGSGINLDLTTTSTVIDSTISGNSAGGNGGGIYAAVSSTVILRNSTLSANTANAGGGAFITGTVSAFTVHSCTITQNLATTANNGGGIDGAANTITIESSIISGNTNAGQPDMSGVTVNLTKSAVGSLTGWTFASGSGNLVPGTDLKLGALANNGGPTLTHLPAVDSPLRGTGSNPALLTTDQRGFPRSDGVGNFDIGAVQVRTTAVNSITRLNPNPTSSGSVQWSVSMTNVVTGLSTANFSLSGAGASGATIVSVSGSGPTYTVAANTGADGDLTLNFATSVGLNLLPTNLPFAGQSYTVNKLTPAVTVFAQNDLTLTDADVGPAKYTFTATFSEAMNTGIVPTIGFPADNPGGSLVLSSSEWLSSTQFKAVYNVNDLGASLPNVVVAISGAKDLGGTTQAIFTSAPAVMIDTANPVVSKIVRVDPINNKLANVSWTVTLSEAVTGLAAANFALQNGGLTGTPSITSVTGVGTTWTVTANTGGSGAGTLGLVAVAAGSATDLNGNPLAALPFAGGSYNIDFISPAASKLTLNTVLLNDTNVGPSGFTATLKYNELMNVGVFPTVSFPAEFPASLTFNSGVWLDAYTYQAKFNVADLGVEQPAIDIRFSGAQDLAGNVQTVFNAVDVFAIDTQNPVISSITSASPNGTYTVGQTIDVTVNFSEDVDLQGTLTLTLDSGGSVVITGPQFGPSLSGVYTVGSGQTSADLTMTAVNLVGTLKDAATNNTVLGLPVSNLAQNAAIVVGNAASVTNLVVNDGAAQRSRLTKVRVDFSAPVDAATLAPTFTRTSGGAAVTIDSSSGVILSATSGMVSSLTLTFANVSNSGLDFASLKDGRWQLSIPAVGYSSPLNGTALRRLFGDFNGDGTVDGGTDFAEFKIGNLTPNSTVFDFNNDGTIDGGTDFAEFGTRFGKTI